VALAREVRVASVLRLQIGFRRRRIYSARDRAARREGGRSFRVSAGRRRPRAIDASWPVRINHKSGSPAPQGQRTLTSQTIPFDHGGRA